MLVACACVRQDDPQLAEAIAASLRGEDAVCKQPATCSLIDRLHCRYFFSVLIFQNLHLHVTS